MYQTVEHRNETFGATPGKLVELRKRPRSANLDSMRRIAMKHGLILSLETDQPQQLQEKQRLQVRLAPLFGNNLPDWRGFWQEWDEFRGKSPTKTR